MPIRHHLLTGLALSLFTCVAAAADLPTPDAVFKKVMGNPSLKNSSGEQFTWFAAYGADDFIQAYRAGGSKDPAYLVQAQAYYDWCIERGVSNDPDGYPGTIGADIGEDVKQATTEHEADTLVGDANIALPLVRFAEIVKADPALNTQFGATADRYIDLATRMVWEKWNKRGCYYEDARGFGSYHTHPFAMAKGDRTKWNPRNHLISDNLNKHYKAGLVLLSLWKLTGKTEYRDRVIAIFGRAKAMFRLIPAEDRIVWNFWMPHGPYDMRGSTPSSWVGVHPDRPGYQAFEAGAFLAVYDAGLVFDQQDMERIVRTNRWMIANGMKSADGTSKAGTIWSALAGLDPEIRAAHAATVKDPVASTNLKLNERTYERRHVKDPASVIVTKVPVQPGTILSMAQPVPDRLEIANDDRIRLVARVLAAGALTVDLLSEDGKTLLGRLHSEDIDPKQGAFSAPRWDGTNPKTGTKDPGTYLLRWTLNGEVREWPVTVITGTKRSGGSAIPVIAPGETLSYDFEGDLDARWTLVGDAATSTDKPKEGAKALKIGRRDSATLTFADQDDLAVRIEFWAFDGGAKHGKSNAHGQSLCVKTADGDLFAIAQMWRGYLNGDGEYNWVNTGENQWFTIHPSGLKRAPGWNRWVFDFTGEGTVVIERDGERLPEQRLQPARYAPKGGVALVFQGASDPKDPELWIDSLTITRPAAK